MRENLLDGIPGSRVTPVHVVEHDYKRLPYPISSDMFLVTRDGVAGTRPEVLERGEAA